MISDMERNVSQSFAARLADAELVYKSTGRDRENGASKNFWDGRMEISRNSRKQDSICDNSTRHLRKNSTYSNHRANDEFNRQASMR